MVEIRAAAVVLAFLKTTSLSCCEEKEFQISSVFEGTKLLKPRSNFILKNLFFSKLNGRKLGFNTRLNRC